MRKLFIIIISAAVGYLPILNGFYIPTSYAEVQQTRTIEMTAEDFFIRGITRPFRDFEGAIADFNEATRLNPKYVLAYYTRALTSYKKFSRDANHEGNTNYQTELIVKAIEDLNQVIKLNPDFVNAFYYRGILNFNLKNQQAAIEDFTQAIRSNSDFAQAYLARGYIYDQVGDIPKATRDYVQVLRTSPDLQKGFRDFGQPLYSLNYKRAIEQYPQIVQKNLEFAHLYYRGLAHRIASERGLNVEYLTGLTSIERESPDTQLSQSIEELTQATKLNPEFADTYYYSENYTQAIRLNPKDAEAYFARAILHESEYLSSKLRASDGDFINMNRELINGINSRLQAIRDYSQAIQINAFYIDAYYRRGLMFSESGNEQKALSDYVIALQLDGRINYYDSQALESYVQALKATPQNAENYYQRGLVRRRLGDEKGAISDFNQAIQLDPKLSEAYHQRGLVKIKSAIIRNLSDWRKIVEDFNQAIQHKPGATDAYFERSYARVNHFARLHYELGKYRPSYQWSYEWALEGFIKVLSLDSSFAQARYTLAGGHSGAFTQDSTGGDAQAQRSLLNVLRTDPDFADAFCSNPNEASCETGHGSIQNYTQVIWLNPNFAEAYSITEFIQFQKKTAQKTIVETNQLLSQNSKDSDAYYRRGTACLKLSKFQEAIQTFTQVIQLNPKDADAYAGRAFAYYRLNAYKAAISDYTQSIQLNPSPDTYFSRSLANYDSGNAWKAFKDANQAVRLDPDFNHAYFVRNLALDKLGPQYKGFKIRPPLFSYSRPGWPCYGGCGAGGSLAAASPDVFFDRGRTLSRQGKKQESIKTLHQAANLFRARGNQARYQEVQNFIRNLEQR